MMITFNPPTTMKSILKIKLDTKIPDYHEMFRDLLAEIDKCMLEDLPEAEQFQKCFWIAAKHYKLLKNYVLLNGFLNEVEEIEYFREVKPKFACLIEFFVIGSEALWFASNRARCTVGFWNEEAEKYSRFSNKHHDFIEYYTKGRHNLDAEYFMQATADPISAIYSKMFDEPPFLYSSKDWLVRSFLAHRMYSDFVKDQIKKIRKDQS
jgi:hypothetical protein